MSASITFFPVGNGDMTLIETATGRKILIDCNIRDKSKFPDVIAQLKERLTKNADGRYFIDLFIWTHPDNDHCLGVAENFHLGKVEDFPKLKEKILINEIWASPLVYKRASTNHTLSEDAKSLNTEIKRRVEYYKSNKYSSIPVGEQVKLITEFDEEKTSEIPNIVVKLDDLTSSINNSYDSSIAIRVLGPSPFSEIEEDILAKNHSSIIANIALKSSNSYAQKEYRFLVGGDAEVECWKHLWNRLNTPYANKTEWLNYTVLLAPHHCSWHSLSFESWSGEKEKGKVAQVCEEAKSALCKVAQDGFIIAASQTIEDNDIDPPCIGAKKAYIGFLDGKDKQFLCVQDHLNADKENIPLVIDLHDDGPKVRSIKSIFNVAPSSPVNRDTSGGYA